MKTIKNYLRIPFNCSHILYGIVAYHIIWQTLVANALNISYVHVETVLLCRTVNHQFNYGGLSLNLPIPSARAKYHRSQQRLLKPFSLHNMPLFGCFPLNLLRPSCNNYMYLLKLSAELRPGLNVGFYMRRIKY